MVRSPSGRNPERLAPPDNQAYTMPAETSPDRGDGARISSAPSIGGVCRRPERRVLSTHAGPRGPVTRVRRAAQPSANVENRVGATNVVTGRFLTGRSEIPGLWRRFVQRRRDRRNGSAHRTSPGKRIGVPSSWPRGIPAPASISGPLALKWASEWRIVRPQPARIGFSVTGHQWL